MDDKLWCLFYRMRYLKRSLTSDDTPTDPSQMFDICTALHLCNFVEFYFAVKLVVSAI